MNEFLICADASSDTGTGHLRRMLTLTRALLDEQSVHVTLQTSELGAEIAKSADINGLSVIIASCDPEAVAKSLKQQSYDAVVLDNYHWDADGTTVLRDHVGLICVIDDLADRVHNADVLVDQNAHHSAADYDGLVPTSCNVLAGAKYCLLPEAFRSPTVRKHDALALDADAPIFISLGGGDPNNDLVSIVETVLKETSFRVTIATGSHIADALSLQAIADAHTDRVELIFDSTRVVEQMMASKFAVASGGTMTWERAAVGLPSLCLVVADNQIDCTRWLEQQGVHDVFDIRQQGWSRPDLARAIQLLGQDENRRKGYALMSKALITGEGAVLTARTLLDSLNNTAS